MKNQKTVFALVNLQAFTKLFMLIVFCLWVSSVSANGITGQHRKAEKEISNGNFEQAEHLYQEIIKKNAKDVEAHLGLGQVYLKRRNLQEAFDIGIKALQMDVNNTRARAIVATALLRSGYIEKSREQLNYTLQINPREDLALATSAEIDLYESRIKEAYQKLRQATSIRPAEGDYWLILARAASRQEFFKEAAESLRQFLQNSPKTDVERRSRIDGVIKFYTYLGESHLYQIKGKSADIALQIKLRRPHLEIKINGKETLKFVIDTGAGICVLSPEAAARVGVKEIARGGEARAVGGEGSFPIVYGLIDELQLGDIKVNAVPTYIRKVHSVSNAKAEDIADGYLGLSLLSNFLMTMDYKNGQLKLVMPDDDDKTVKDPAKEAEKIPNSTIVPFRTTESGLISIESKVNDDATVNLIFDSGATSSVISSTVVDSQKWESKILKETVKVVGAAGLTEDVKLISAKVQIVDLLRENMRMPILNLARINEQAGFEQQGILGGDFLYHCRIQIDFRKLQLTLTPNSSTLKRVGEALLEKDKQ